LAQGAACRHDSEGNDHETGLDLRAVEYRVIRAGTCRLAAESRKRLAENRALRREVETIFEKGNIKWLSPFQLTPLEFVRVKLTQIICDNSMSIFSSS
jgi:hypothetical protein